MKRTTVRIRGMNAVATNGTEEKYPHSSVRQLLVAVVVLAIGGGVAWYTIAKVGTTTVYAGIVQPEQSVDLDFTQTGRVTQILVKPGERVIRGQALAVQDQTVAQVNLTNAQAVLTATQAKLTALEAPTVSDTARKNLDLQVEKANTQLAGAQKAATDAQNKSNAEIAQAQQGLKNAQAKLETDSGQYRDQCTGDDVPKQCTALQAQVQQDNTAVSTATSNLATKEASGTRAQTTADNAVNNARASLALVQNQQSNAAAPAAPAQISSAQADVAAAKAAVDQAKAALDSLTLTAPMAGTVANIGGIVGELDGPSGIRAFSGPQAVQPGNGPAFTLFPPPDGSAAAKSPGDDQQPLVSLVTSSYHAIAQVGESAVAKLRPGAPARITVNTVKQVIDASVDAVIPVPVNQGGSVSYQVKLTVPDWPAGTVPGMSLSVEFP